MENSVLKRLFSHFGRHAFEAFMVELFGSAKRSEPFNKLPDAGGGAYYQPILDSYGGSLHSVFLLHYSPLELLNDPGEVMVTDPQLIGRATMIRDLYKGQIGYPGRDHRIRHANLVKTASEWLVASG